MYAKLLWYVYNWKDVLKGQETSLLEEPKLNIEQGEVKVKYFEDVLNDCFYFLSLHFSSPCGKEAICLEQVLGINNFML